MTNNPEVSPATLECKNCGQPILMGQSVWHYNDWRYFHIHNHNTHCDLPGMYKAEPEAVHEPK